MANGNQRNYYDSDGKLVGYSRPPNIVDKIKLWVLLAILGFFLLLSIL